MPIFPAGQSEARMRFMVKVTMTHGTQFWTSLIGA